jgi:hypothetical protein
MQQQAVSALQRKNAAVISQRTSKKDCKLLLYVFLSLTQHCSQANNADTA